MKKICFLFIFLGIWTCGIAQKKDSLVNLTKLVPSNFFAGNLCATNNGISLLPNFTLGKPAALFDLSIGRGKLSFDPMMRFAMNGKPWAFIFWWRYKLVAQPKFKMSVGAHPSFVFRESKLFNTKGDSSNYLTAQRYFAGELTPTYYITPKIGIGIHYLTSFGLSELAIKRTNFVAFRSIMTNLSLPKNFTLTFIPQVYYLSMDSKQGTYVNATVMVGKRNFPLAVSSVVSQAINTTISGNKLVWNVGLNYVFNKKYVRF